ncbi:glycosyl transferase family protein [Ascosphaera apis ARSEF 7405]|uniref:Glycosyl transferase family protein n=1 Tax=Ascosphaera apis ARSEF 7405 TaxID=392613 RepID=A0A162IKR8_9EURO|nr:glycosyl transferase family protein [Ascosphaera apis ARSEF 7405]
MFLQDEIQGQNQPLNILENVDPNSDQQHQHPKRVWTTLITNTAYLPGLLTLAYSLQQVGSRYPLIALYTDTFPPEGHAALDARGILKKRIPYLLPSVHKDYSNDVRFYDCWSKLAPFGLMEYERVVQLDSDMMVVQKHG